MSVGEGVGRTQCDCTNITIMQLFYELKQQYPSISDQLVASCVSDHSQHIKPSRCREKLERELNKLSRAYPQQFMGHRMNTDIVPRKINETFVHSNIPNVLENNISNTSPSDNSTKNITTKSTQHLTNFESDNKSDKTFVQTQNDPLTNNKLQNLKEQCSYTPQKENPIDHIPQSNNKYSQNNQSANKVSKTPKEIEYKSPGHPQTFQQKTNFNSSANTSLCADKTKTSPTNPSSKESNLNKLQQEENLLLHQKHPNSIALQPNSSRQELTQSPNQEVQPLTSRKNSACDISCQNSRTSRRSVEVSQNKQTYSSGTSQRGRILNFCSTDNLINSQNDNQTGFYPISRSKKQINSTSREILKKERPLSFPQFKNSEECSLNQFCEDKSSLVRPNFFPVPLLKNSDCEKKPPISPSSIKKFLKSSPTKSKVLESSNKCIQEDNHCYEEQFSHQIYSGVVELDSSNINQEQFSAIKKVPSPTKTSVPSPQNCTRNFGARKKCSTSTKQSLSNFLENQENSTGRNIQELDFNEGRNNFESPKTPRKSPDYFGVAKKISSPNKDNGTNFGPPRDQRRSIASSPNRSILPTLAEYRETFSRKEASTCGYYEERSSFGSTADHRTDLQSQEENQETSFRNSTNLGAKYQNRPTSLELKQSDINLSVNVNCQVDVLTSPRKQTTLQITPELSWCPEAVSANTPRSFTSVNLTLRTPTSEPLPPIDICSSNSSLTYSTSSFNPKQGLQSRLQITVGPSGIGNVTSVRSRPRSSYIPKVEEIEMIPNKAGSLPDLANAQACSDTKVQLVNHQLERKELLRRELEAGKNQRDSIKKEVDRLKLQITDEDKNVLLKHIAHLRAQCAMLTKEVDRQSEPRVPLGETNREFYRNIDRSSGRSQRSVSESASIPASPISNSSNNQNVNHEPDDSDKWPCHMCTFRNHPLLNKCEQCEMPRILLVSAIPGDNIHIRFSPGNTRRVIHSWVV